MNLNRYISPLTIALFMGVVFPAQAAKPIVLHKTSFNQIQQKFQLCFPGVSNRCFVSKDSLQFVKQHTDINKVMHVRMQQYYQGFPVFGGYAIVHTKHALRSLTFTADANLNGRIYTELQSELGPVDSSFIKNASVALEQFKNKYAPQLVSEAQVIPIIYIDDRHKAHWAYKLSVLITPADKIPERPTAIIDAKTYQPLVEWNAIKTELIAAKGRGYGGNYKIGKFMYGKELPLLELMFDTEAQMCLMENPEVRVVDMMHKYSSKNNPMKFSCATSMYEPAENIFYTGYNNDGYDKENGAASPTNDALYAGYVIKHMYHDWYGLEVLTKSNGSPMKLIMRVHYGQNYENAYWDGKQMTFGDGDTLMHPLVSLGVGAHEISHGFTEQHSALEYFGQSGGINESFSDMAAQAAEFYSSGKNSWKIGSEIVKKNSGYEALRFMNKPSLDGISIDSADEYHAGLDVHYSSGVFNHLFYIISTQPGWNIRMSFDLMVKANVDYWTPYATFEEAGCGVLFAAKDLGFSLSDVEKSLTAVAINYETCMIEDI